MNSEDRPDEDGSGPGEARAAMQHGVTVAGIVAGVLLTLILTVFPTTSARGGPVFYLPLVLAFVASVAWSSYRVVASWSGRNNHRVLRLLVVPGALLLPLLYTAAGPEESIGRRACTFGPWGIAKGTVWFKVAPPESGPNEPREKRNYEIDMVWGAAEVHKTFMLAEPTYFAFNQHDFKAPGADIRVRPANARISCGFGNPPKGPRIDLTGEDFTVKQGNS